jgi:hypothetical protein
MIHFNTIKIGDKYVWIGLVKWCSKKNLIKNIIEIDMYYIKNKIILY